jgi:galactokinase
MAAAYRRRFDGAEPSVFVRAPGRVNLIGEHVDYSGGLVLPIAIDRAVYAVAGPAAARRVVVHTSDLDASTEFDLGNIHKPASPGWDAYPKGVATELLKSGAVLRGTNIYVASDLPVGAGLSSSAAFEVAVALALLSVAGTTMPPQKVSRLCRSAEHDYAGVPCGIMDQYACTLAAADHVLLIDCLDENTELIPWPTGDVVVLVIDSRCRHRLTEGMYADRVRQCMRAVEGLRIRHPEIHCLRQVSLQRLLEEQSRLDPVTFRRARHVVTEIERTRQAVEALRSGDFAALGRLMNESHRSLRDDYEVSSTQLDDLVAVVCGVPAVLGARLTGAGFGGCIVAVAGRQALPEIASAVRQRYDAPYGVRAEIMPSRPSAGASTINLTP